MTWQLQMEVENYAPLDITQLEMNILTKIAQKSHHKARTVHGRHVPARSCFPSAETLARWLRTTPDAVKGALDRLAKRGLECRVPVGKNKNGDPQYAVKGVTRQFVLPDLKAWAEANGQEPQGAKSGPEADPDDDSKVGPESHLNDSKVGPEAHLNDSKVGLTIRSRWASGPAKVCLTAHQKGNELEVERRGGTDTVVSPTAADENSPPENIDDEKPTAPPRLKDPTRCRQHQGPDIPPNCGNCADARRAEAARIREKSAREAEANREASRLAALERIRCQWCDVRGYCLNNPRAVCDHTDPEVRNAEVAAGVAQLRAALRQKNEAAEREAAERRDNGRAILPGAEPESELSYAEEQATP